MPGNYRWFSMLSHVRKLIETTLTGDVEKKYETDESQFDFQRERNMFQAAVDVA